MVVLSLPNLKQTRKLIMLRTVVLVLTVICAGSLFAQSPKITSKRNLSEHPADHFIFQLSSDRWLQAPDSIGDKRRGNSRGVNIYVMFDKPFPSNHHFSIAFGAGIGTSHIFLEKMNAKIDGNTPTLLFEKRDGLSYYKKYKIATTYLEAPVEFRYSSNPANPAKSFKLAVGARIGTLLNAHTKGKIEKDASGNTISSSVEKVSTKSYFNSTRLAATARVGYGNICLFGGYTLGSVFKDGVAPDMRLLQVGLSISGL